MKKNIIPILILFLFFTRVLPALAYSGTPLQQHTLSNTTVRQQEPIIHPDIRKINLSDFLIQMGQRLNLTFTHQENMKEQLSLFYDFPLTTNYLKDLTRKILTYFHYDWLEKNDGSLLITKQNRPFPEKEEHWFVLFKKTYVTAVFADPSAFENSLKLDSIDWRAKSVWSKILFVKTGSLFDKLNLHEKDKLLYFANHDFRMRPGDKISDIFLPLANTSDCIELKIHRYEMVDNKEIYVPTTINIIVLEE